MSSESKSEVINSLAYQIHDINVKKGFWDHLNTDDTKFYLSEKLALAHSELSEALAADRDPDLTGPQREYEILVELADCVIRCLDLAQVVGRHEDFGSILQAKIIHNDLRPHLHAKRY